MEPGFDNEEPLTPSERLGAGLFLLLVLGLFGAAIVVEFQPVKLTVLFFLASWAGLLFLHETGHALMAMLMGWRVIRVCIGTGRVVGRFQWRRTAVELRIYPVMDYVLPAPRRIRLPRLENALIYFAGPGIELLILGLVVVLVGPETLLTRTEELGMLAVQSLALAIAVSVVVNLAPHATYTAKGPLVSDGLGILQSFAQPLSYYEELRDAGEQEEMENLERREEGRWG